MKARQYGLLVSGVLALAIAIGWYAFSAPFGASKAPVKLTAQSTGKLQCDLPAPDAASPHPGMVWVPASSTWATRFTPKKSLCAMEVKGFWMDRTEVTNQEFEAFVKATSYVTVAERPVDPKYHAGLPEAMRQAGAVVFRMPDKLTQRLLDDPRQWWQYIPGANAW